MKNNFFYKIVALFLAILLWLYVTNQQNPLTEATFTVPLDVKNLPNKLVVSEKLSSATVRLMARKSILEKLSTKDIHAYLNLVKPKIGLNKAAITVTLPRDIQFVSVTPLQGDITLTTVSTRQLPLRIQFINPLPIGYILLGQQITPSQVVINGPQNVLEKVARVIVEADLSDQKNNYIQRLPIRIYDEKNNDLSDWLKSSPEVAEVFLAIAPNQPRKQVAIKPFFHGALPGGLKITRVVVEPQLITLTGNENAIAGLYFVETMPIELKDKNNSFTTEAFLKLPEGVAAYPTPKARITVDLGK